MWQEAMAKQGSTRSSKATARLPHNVLSYHLEVATAAHDLRNRLSVASCQVNELRQRLSAHVTASRADISEYLESIERSMAHTNRLMEDLLELATEQSDPPHDPDWRSVDLVACASRVAALVRRAMHGPHLTVRANVPTLVGAWDETKIACLFCNLVTNAVKYSAAGADVVLTVDRADNSAVVRVVDHGIGTPASELPHIFEPFYRARNAEHTAPGLGLGLASARMIVERYNGSIEVHSAEGVETVFTVCLPLVDSPCASPVPRFGSALSTGARRGASRLRSRDLARHKLPTQS
jgi:signal transduction histidine kinase